MLIWLGAIALPLCVAGNKQSHYLIPLLPPAMILSAWLVDRWNIRALNILVIACAIVLAPLTTEWILPRYIPADTRETARLVRDRFGDGPYCFYGLNSSVPLCFNLRQSIPLAETEEQLKRILEVNPNTIIITIGKDKRPTTAPARRLRKIEMMKREDQVWEFYRFEPESTPTQS